MAGKYALVIGNAVYDDERILNLRKPAIEAGELSRVLADREIGDFKTRPLLNASVDSMRREIARLFSKRAKDDLVLLYFSGHGLKDEAGDLHLAAKDTEFDLLGGAAVPASYVTEQMSRSRSRRQVLILDCCFSGAFSSGIKGAATVGTASAFRGDGFGHVVLTATDSIQYSWEDPADDEDEIDGSVFTHYLIHGLETGEADLGRDGRIDLDELYDYVYENVVRLTPRQTPGKWTYKQQGVLVIAESPHLLAPTEPTESPTPTAPPVRTPWTHGSPFRGLRAFDAEHASIFYGREKAIRDVLQKLSARAEAGCAFLLVLGMSGGGKSSLLRAGVLPRLAAAGDDARRTILRPSDAGGDVFRALTEALLRPDALPDLAEADSEDLTRSLRTSPSAALMMIQGALKQDDGRTTRLVLLVDQLEELFAPEIEEEERRRFIETLDVFARHRDIWILATLRSDFYARCNEIEALMKLKSDGGQYDLIAPNEAEIGQMIRMPARSAGLTFEEKDGVLLSDLLRDAAVRNRQALPLLQFALEELYKGRTGKDVLTYAAYERLGGMEGALTQRAEEVFAEATAQQQAELPRMLRALVRIDADEALSRRSVSLTSFSGASREFVDAFVEARLLVTETGKNDDATVAVAHEALLEHWPRLRGWLEDDREALRVRGRVAAEASLWQQKGRAGDFLLQQGKPVLEAEELLTSHGDELTGEERAFIQASSTKNRRFQRVKQGVMATLALLSLIAVIAAFTANTERHRAEGEALKANRTLELFMSIFAGADPEETRGQNLRVRDVLDENLSRFEDDLDDQPLIQAELLTALGSTYAHIGVTDTAERLLTKALEIRRKEKDIPPLELAQTLRDLADLYFIAQNFKRAEELIRETLKIRRKHLGEKHPETLETYGALGKYAHLQGRYSEADEIYQKVIEEFRSIDARSAMHHYESNYGTLISVWKSPQEAEPILRQAVEGIRTEAGDLHPSLAVALGNHASTLMRLRRYKDVKGLLEEAIQIQEATLNKNSPRLWASKANLGVAERRLGNLPEARILQEEVLQHSIREYGVDDQRVAAVRNDLGVVLIDLKEWEPAAEQFYEATRVMRLHLDGEESKSFGTALMNLGRVLEVTDRHEEAIERTHEALTVLRESVPENDGRLAFVRAILSAALAENGKCPEAEGFAGEANAAQPSLPLSARVYFDECLRTVEQKCALDLQEAISRER